MSGAQRSLADSIEPFFGFDKRAVHFLNSTYFHSNYTECCNSQAYPDGLVKNMASLVMFQENYNTRDTGASNHDIHHEYTDFIVKTALFHRQIDKSTLAGSGLVKFREAFTETVQVALSQTIADMQRDTVVNVRRGIKSRGAILFNHLGDANDMTFEDLGLTIGSSFFEFIVAAIFTIAKQYDNVDVFDNRLNLVHVDIDAGRNTTIRAGVERANDASSNRQIGQFFNTLVGVCNPDGTFGTFYDTMSGNYCLAGYFDTARPGRGARPQVAATAIREIATRINRGNPDIVVQNTIANIGTSFIDCTIALAKNIFTGGLMQRAHAAFGALVRPAAPGTNIQALKDAIKVLFQEALNVANPLRSQYEKELANAAFLAIKAQINPGSRANHHMTDSNNETRAVIEHVFNEWNNLDSKARNFYAKHLHIFAATDAGSLQDDVDLLQNGSLLTPYLRGNVRLNLMKDKSLKDVLFMTTLPWLPTSGDAKVEKVFYTANGGVIKSFPAAVDSIRRLYNDMYLNATFSPAPGVANLAIPATYDAAVALYGSADFDLVDMNLIYNYINASNTNNTRSQAQSAASTFDELLAEDLTTHEVIGRDAKGLYKLVNGQKVYAPTADNCAGTFLGDGTDNGKCVHVVAECLSTGNKDDLAKCLDNMRDANMFQVAYTELNKMHPQSAIAILKLFGIETYDADGITRVESLDDWIAREVNNWKSDVRNAILNNQQLKDYLYGVINFVNDHPSILNDNIVDGDNAAPQEKDHEEDTRMDKQYFVQPRKNSAAEKLFDGARINRWIDNREAMPLISGMVGADVYSNTLRGQLNAIHGFTTPGFGVLNMIGGAPARTTIQSPSGNIELWENTLEKRYGNNDLDSDLLYGLYNTVLTDLRRAGLPLKQSDEDELLKGIEQLRENEKKLAKLYMMLRTLADLLTFFKNSCCEPLNLPKNVSIRDLKSRQHTIAFLKNAIFDMEECVAKNAKSQNNVCNNMIKHFGTLFEKLGSK